jgi:4-hydroxythreonine-4-phosphate dehydrogenase
MVTCPVSKEAIDSGGISGFRGQTEYLAASTRTKDFLMLLLNGSLRFSLLTRHMPLKDVPSGLTEGNIYRTIILTHRYIKQLFSIRRPRLAVCGLNPHASDNGLLGQEENDIIGPAVERAEKKAGGISGPLPADSAAFKAAQGLYDCVVAIYHDQALIPLKMFRAYGGVNITAGLPFVRCSPLHGTAFDIAAKPKLARPDSLIEAARLAIKCSLSLRKN